MNAVEKMYKGFFDLLSIKEFNDINVSELCAVSKVHRTTFYNNFSNLYDLLKAAKAYAVDEFLNSGVKLPGNKEYLSYEVLVPYLNFIKNYPNLFKAYLSNAMV